MKFTEEKLENAFTELLEQGGFNHEFGISRTRNIAEVLIEEDLRKFLSNQYVYEGITVNEVNSIILQLKALPASDFYECNKTYMRMLSDGCARRRL